MERVWEMGFTGEGFPFQILVLSSGNTLNLKIFAKRFTNIFIGTRIAISFVGPNPNHRDLIGHMNPEVSFDISSFPSFQWRKKNQNIFPRFLSRILPK